MFSHSQRTANWSTNVFQKILSWNGGWLDNSQKNHWDKIWYEYKKKNSERLILKLFEFNFLGFPYFYVDFNMEFGYAHIVEKEKSFDSNMHMVLIENFLFI